MLGALLAALGGATSSSAKQQPAGPPDTYVTYWDNVGSLAFTAAAPQPPTGQGFTAAEGHVIFAYVAIAVYDAVIAIEGGYEPFANDVDGPADASPQAAVAAAAHRILEYYMPAQEATIIDPAYVTSLASIPPGLGKTHGMAIGEAVANLLIAQRSDDGFRASTPPYVPPSPPIPGVWIPTATTPPIGPYLGLMRPFSIPSADVFRPNGPPALDTKKWADDYNEVKEVGSSTAPATVRSADQTLAARFWAEPPVQQARASFRTFILDHQLDVADAARFNAMVSVSYADALIACFDAKYHYKFWRPVTAIRAGNTDGNDATVGDSTWNTLLAATPNHPEYPSAHSCITPTGGLVIAHFLHSPEIDFTVPSISNPSLGDRHFARVKDLEYEVTNARIWGGIHYRFSVDDGTKIGKKVADQVLSHHFHKSND